MDIKHPGPGRPKLDNAATEWLQIRVTPGVKADLKKRATAEGVSISKYVLKQLGA